VAKQVRTIPLAFLAVLAAGCSFAAHPPGEPISPSPTPARSSVIRTLRPVAKLTSACAVLSAAEVNALIGGDEGAMAAKAVEDKPSHSYGYTFYTCEYGTGSGKPFALTVMGIAQKGYTPKVAIDAVAKGHTKARRLTGIGGAAVLYPDKHGLSVIAAGRRSHGQTRTMTFAAPVDVPAQKLVDVAKLVIGRI
jgi:hypothetical protein